MYIQYTVSSLSCSHSVMAYNANLYQLSEMFLYKKTFISSNFLRRLKIEHTKRLCSHALINACFSRLRSNRQQGQFFNESSVCHILRK